MACSGMSIAQVTDTLSGVVSYSTSQHIYVRFTTTENITPGDTLFMVSGDSLQPALVVKHLSTTSCVTSSLIQPPPGNGVRIVARHKKKAAPEVVQQENKGQVDPQIFNHPDSIDPVPAIKTKEDKLPAAKVDKLKGRITIASYINATGHPDYDRIRMRYTFSLNAARIGNSKASFESYFSFRHTVNEWEEVKNDFNRVFKIYSLALQYDVTETFSVWLGRKINYNLSNIGAIDGVQAEKKWRSFFAGAFAGSRPDHTDYSFNFNLLQVGAFGGHKIEGKHGTIQNTLAFAEQRNHAVTDRRFGYFQHTNSMIPKINVFSSFEFDLYTLENNQPKNTFSISSIYVSLRYRPSDKLSVSGSYDARKNIIYYETYKSFIDQLLEDETRQGLRFTFNYRPMKYVTIGTSAGYRFQKGNPNANKNLHSYVTVSRLPLLHASGTLSTTVIQSSYLTGVIYGGRLSRDLMKGKLFGELSYRIVHYQYTNVEDPLEQSILGANMSWRMNKKLSLSVNYEGEMGIEQMAHRVYINITQRL